MQTQQMLSCFFPTVLHSSIKRNTVRQKHANHALLSINKSRWGVAWLNMAIFAYGLVICTHSCLKLVYGEQITGFQYISRTCWNKQCIETP